MKILYLASYTAGDDQRALEAPFIDGALLTYYWSQLEPESGVYYWHSIDNRIGLWASHGKKVAIRIVQSSDGNWPHPMASTPTPEWLFRRGAKYVVATSSDTLVPLCHDPLYQKFFGRLVQRLAGEYDGNPNVCFIDLTPGAETNPYRYSLDSQDPTLNQRFMEARDSEGRVYSSDLWLETIEDHIETARSAFVRTPVLCTLHDTMFDAVGNAAVSAGCYTGQNGLKGDSYRNPNGPWARAFLEWGPMTYLYFEAFGPSSDSNGKPENGTLREQLEAAKRIGADYLGLYAQDLLLPSAAGIVQEALGR